MKMMKHLMVCVILLGILFLISCAKKDVEDGWVKFGFLGNEYTIKQRQFTIRANPLIGEGEKVKNIQKGEEIKFEFRLGPTRARAKKELEILGKQLEPLAEGNIPPAKQEISTFEVIWYVETTDPLEVLRHRISYNTEGLNLNAFVFSINVSEYMISNPPKKKT